MKKSWYQSKTLCGFGIAGVIEVGQLFSVGYSDTAVTSLVQILSTLFGVYGLRTAIK